MPYVHQIFPYGNYVDFCPLGTEINFGICDRMLRRLLPDFHTLMLSVYLLFLCPNNCDGKWRGFPLLKKMP